MRRVVYVGLLAFALLAASSCDTEQPSTVDLQTADLRILAGNATVLQYNVWDLTEDSDFDGVPDDVNGDGATGDRSLWCACTSVSPMGECNGVGPANSVPWTYAVKVSVIRAGAIVVDEETGLVLHEQLTSTAAEGAGLNRAPYDDLVGSHAIELPSIDVSHKRGRCSLKQQIKCNPDSVTAPMTTSWCSRNNAGTCQRVFNCTGDFDTLCSLSVPGTCEAAGKGTCENPTVNRRFDFPSTSRRKLSNASRELLNAADNFIYETCVGDAVCEADVEGDLGSLTPALGACPGSDLGNPALDPNTSDANSDAAIFGFTLNKGDTVFVEARRSDTVPGGNVVIPFTPETCGNAPCQEPGISAEFFVNGAQLQAAEVQGNLVYDVTDESPNIAFSFTSK